MLKSFFEDKFVPVAAKIAKQRHLLAMRDGLVLSLPLLIVGPWVNPKVRVNTI